MATAVQHQPSASRRASGGPSTAEAARKRMSTLSGSSGGREPDAKSIGLWRIGRTIGKGSSGRVKIAKHAKTGQYAAVKIVPKGMLMSSRMSMNEVGARSEKLLLGIEREIIIMKLIDHPNVLSLYDVWETNSDLYLVMEYVPGGELFDYLVRRGRLPHGEALHYFQQIIYAVDYCHRFNICHRDLKPENLLLDKDKNIKVADFGMAAWQADERMLETSCGSPHYASPEIVAGKAYNGTSSDIWSCGIILFALLTGRLPFDDDNIRNLLQKVKLGHFEMPDDIVGSARDLLARMLEKEPEKRITMPEILQHPFFVSRPPRLTGGRTLPAPPSLDIMARSVEADEVDPDILSNLKTLWHGASEGDIYKALMSRDKTWEKAIYHLLVDYRNRHLENYNMDDDSDDDDTEDEDRARPHARPVGRYQPAILSPSKKHRVSPPKQIRRKPAPLSENETIQHHNTPPPRPQAPTPKKAAMAPIVDSPVQRRPSKLAPRSPAPAGPRSPGVRGPPTPTAPAIMLQEATPVKDLPPQVESQRAHSPAPVLPAMSPTVSLRSPVLGAGAAAAGALSPPHVENPQLQTFLHEIANQLNTMNIRSSTTSSNSASSAISPEYQAYMNYVSQQATPQATPRTEASELGDDNDQFADADDDMTGALSERMSIGSIHSMRKAVGSPLSPIQTGAIGLGAPSRAPSRSGPPPVSGRWSHGSGSYRRRSASGRSESPGPSPGLYSPNPGFGAQFEWAHGANNLPAVPPAKLQAAATQLKAQRSAPPPPPKAASRPAPPRPQPRVPIQSVIESERIESLLGRENSYVLIDGNDMPEDVSSWNSRNSSGFHTSRGADGFGMLKKRKKVEPAPVAHSVDKRSWFNNLFSFKPASCTLTLSSPSIREARDKCTRVLQAQGVRVSVASIDGQTGLRCKVSDTRDISGNTVKGVRFRVEFDRSVVDSPSRFATTATLTLEKGAQSTFTAAYNRLRVAMNTESHPPTPSRNTFSLPPTARPNARPSLYDAGLAPERQAGSASAPSTPAFGPASTFGHNSHLPRPTTIRY